MLAAANISGFICRFFTAQNVPGKIYKFSHVVNISGLKLCTQTKK